MKNCVILVNPLYKLHFFQCLNKHTKMTDISGKEMRVTEIVGLAFHFINNDCNSAIFNKPAYSEKTIRTRNVLVFPSQWNEKTRSFFQEAAQRVINVYNFFYSFSTVSARALIIQSLPSLPTF